MSSKVQTDYLKIDARYTIYKFTDCRSSIEYMESNKTVTYLGARFFYLKPNKLFNKEIKKAFDNKNKKHFWLSKRIQSEDMSISCSKQMYSLTRE